MNQLREPTADGQIHDHGPDAPADDIAWAAETLASMSGTTANAISTTQRVAPADVLALRRMLPSLAARYGFGARIESDGDRVTVRFVRERQGVVEPASVPD
jgi:hypothetical protein